MPPSVTAPYFGDPLTVKVARRGGIIQMSDLEAEYVVIASEAKQSRRQQARSGLLRRFAPRNDNRLL
jgi:hypothetical protein